jgi:gliding motility-associated-like protein
MEKLLIILTFFLHYCTCVGQRVINWGNPSFESQASQGKIPSQWYNCGPPRETEPDTQPGSFGIQNSADDGNTYLGMVMRDNNTKESVSQKLKSSIQPFKKCTFAVSLYCAELLISTSPLTGVNQNYNNPGYLKVYGGNNFCDKTELLYTTPSPVSNRNWKRYEIEFHTTSLIDFILFELDFAPTGVNYEPYAGNIMIDNLSPIIESDTSAIPKKDCIAMDSFSPNGDGENDFFLIDCGDINDIAADILLEIYDEKNILVFDKMLLNAKSKDVSWNGLTNNGEKAKIGSYFYHILCKRNNNQEKYEQGIVKLIR